mmetsp:Transcript_83432/g.244618  ORF Transcript_83432/g.244618 Transcript_83432/m.244618 type:complete len:231 (+) Transcript_83432:608-1300(+)
MAVGGAAECRRQRQPSAGHRRPAAGAGAGGAGGRGAEALRGGRGGDLLLGAGVHAEAERWAHVPDLRSCGRRLRPPLRRPPGVRVPLREGSGHGRGRGRGPARLREVRDEEDPLLLPELAHAEAPGPSLPARLLLWRLPMVEGHHPASPPEPRCLHLPADRRGLGHLHLRRPWPQGHQKHRRGPQGPDAASRGVLRQGLRGHDGQVPLLAKIGSVLRAFARAPPAREGWL